MLLICGGLNHVANQNHDEKPIAFYPTVVGYLDDHNDPNYRAKLDVMLENIHSPFVVRLLDKDLAKIACSDVGRKILVKDIIG